MGSLPKCSRSFPATRNSLRGNGFRVRLLACVGMAAVYWFAHLKRGIIVPFNTSTVGAQTKEFVHSVDARWLMAYASGIGDAKPAFLDTESHAVIGHPVFPVCLEWPAILECYRLPGTELVTADERARNVHAAHDLHIFRPIRAGEQLATTATVVGLTRIKPGAAQTIRLDTVAEDGELVCRTYQLGIKRQVEILGAPRVDEQAPDFPVAQGGAAQRFEIPIATTAAHVYTECARIWNPVHTDRAVALAAGLPDIILHGTATLAMAVSRIVDHCIDGDPTRVTRLGGRFSAMVLMPSTITLAIHAHHDGVINYTVFCEDDRQAISQGFVCYR
jgi:acyl dehydratase